MKTIAFFNNKGGVGKTTLVYHLAWMFQELGLSVLAVDLDPQSNLTSFFLDDEEIEGLWNEPNSQRTVLGCVQPLIERLGDIRQPEPIERDGIGLLAGDLGLSTFEDRLAQAWPAGFDPIDANRHDSFRVTSSFARLITRMGESRKADIALMDVGPSLGALNRAALIAADYVVIPLGADLFSLRGLRNLGPVLGGWRSSWADMQRRTAPFELPPGRMKPLGWVLLQHAAVKASEPVKAYGLWASRVPTSYRDSFAADGHQLALLKHYRSLAPMAQEARRPMFRLTAADGALGSHAAAVQRCREDFRALALKIAELASYE